MRVLVLATVLVLGVSGSAWALGDAVIDYCLTTANPKACLQSVQREVDQAQREHQHAMLQQQQAAQIEAARLQANGLAAFGSGRALVNGMNQGLRQMEVHPYVLPPAQHYGSR